MSNPYESDDRTPAEQALEQLERELDATTKFAERLNAKCNGYMHERDEAARERDYWKQKATYLAGALDGKRTMEAHSAVALDEARDFVASLTSLAEQAQRATTDTERLMAASLVIAKLIRPRGEGTGPGAAEDIGLRVAAEDAA